MIPIAQNISLKINNVILSTYVLWRRIFIEVCRLLCWFGSLFLFLFHVFFKEIIAGYWNHHV